MGIPGLDQVPPAIGAGLAGAVTGALTMTGTLTERIAAGVAGGFCSMFIGPVAAPFVFGWMQLINKAIFSGAVQLDLTHVVSFTGFVLGVAGMTIVSGVQRVTRSASRRASRLIEGDG